jgi:hypothetical protein
VTTIDVFAHFSMWWLWQETKMQGDYFYLGACTQGKTDALHLVRTVSPAQTEGSVISVFVEN